jgi:hypothetical protein
MKDPKAIRKAIMTAKSIAALVDPHFARVPLPEIGEPAPEEMMPPEYFSIGGPALSAYNAAKRADHEMPRESGRAVESFIGVPPDAMKNKIWGGLMHADPLEDAYSERPSEDGATVRQQLKEKFDPIREKLRDIFGDHIKLYRHQGDTEGHARGQRNTLSWTIDPDVADHFGGIRGKPHDLYSDEDIRRIEDEAHQTGRTQIGKHTLVRNEDDPKYFDIYDRDGEHVTDTDSVSGYLRQENQWFNEANERLAERRSKVKSASVPLDDVIWASNRAGQREFIVHNRPDAPHFIDERGEMPNAEPQQFAAGGEVGAPDYASPDDLGLYSHAAATAASLPQAKASPDEFRNMLTNRGVKPAEFQWSGYDDAFADQPQVTREQVAAHFHENKPPVGQKEFHSREITKAQKDAIDRDFWDKKTAYQKRRAEYEEANPDQEYDPGSAEHTRLLDERHDALQALKSAGDPHHEAYMLPGGENYREVVLKHDDGDHIIKFSGNPAHLGGESNVLTHLLMKDRTDTEGKKVLHLDELQSDWAQQGRKEGFKEGRISPAPYVTNTNDWVDLGLKRALLEAAKGGHDKLALTPGYEAADRYNLSKQIAKIEYLKQPNSDNGYLLAHGHHRANLLSQFVDDKDLPGIIGKDVAEKLIATTPTKKEGDELHRHTLEGLDLNVGGEGMRKFYDEIVPKRLMRLAKMHDPDAQLSASTVEHPKEFSEDEQPNTDRTDLRALEITPRMRESILKKGFPAYAQGGEVEGYQDPATQHISDWNWRPVEDVQESLGGLKEIPSHVEKFGDFMDNIAQRAGTGGLTPRDLIKAYTITRSSIQRQAADVNKLRASGLDLPEDMTGKIRPEGAFGEWLHTPAGQAYLDAAEKGKVHQTAIQNAVKVMAPFGRHQTDIPDALTWAALNLPGREKQVSELVHAGHLMASTPEEWRAFTQHIRGVGPSKSGFLASLMGRGDQPTLDARQIILHTGRPTKEASKYIAKRGGAGGVEAVDRLAARQSAMNLSIPDRLKPYYQHLTHHAVWDKAGNDETTHEDVVRAMHHAASGGEQSAEDDGSVLTHPVAKIFQAIGMAGLNDPSADPEKFKEYLKRAQYALARKITTKGSDVLAANPGAANVKMSDFGKPLSEMESTTISKGMMLPQEEADLEEMQRRKARIFPFLGDLSPADQILLKSGQTKLVDPSEQQGGADFMRSEFAKSDDPAAYGNRIGAAKTLAKKIASQTPEGTPAIGAHVAMGLGSVDSSHHAYEPILRMIPNSPIARKHIDEFDDMMREALPPTKQHPSVWPGIMNTKEAEQFFASRPGTHASFFAKKIDSSKWQKAGFPDIGEVRFSASKPELLGAPRLTAGHAFSEVEPSGRVIASPDLKHRTYPALIPLKGKGYLGGSSVPIPSRLMFSDLYKTLKTKDKSGKAIDYDSPAGQTLFQQSLMTKVPYQEASQEWLDNIMEDRRQKQERGFKKGGKVRSALMIAKGMKKR